MAGEDQEDQAARVDALARRVEALWMTRLDHTIDAVTLGRYELDHVLGRGSQGVVFAAFDRALEREVALKLFRFVDSEREILPEAQTLARLNHPNILTLHDLGCADGFAYLVTELAEGGAMTHWIREPHEWREVVAMFAQAARGLAAAHGAGIVHGDVKPGNMLIGSDGRVRVADFGFARALGRARREAGGNHKRFGTEAYLAPECWLEGEVDRLADQFSFCASLWEALYGCRPWAVGAEIVLGEVEPSKRRVLAGAPEELEGVLRRGLAGRPRERYPSMDALAEALGLRYEPAVVDASQSSKNGDASH